MTDKQLINGLKYEKLSEEQLYDLSQWELVDIILAYRKNYKAKEQKCESLKKEKAEILQKTGMIETLQGYTVKDIECMEQQLDQLKAENDELKKCYKNNLVVLDFEETNTTKLVNKVMKLEKTLAEIEKLAIRGDVYCIDYNVDDCEKCIKQSDCKTTLFKQILQIINEVENEQNSTI